MHIFAQKQKPTLKAKSATSTRPCRAFTGQSREVSSILPFQRTIGNQAVQRLMQTNAEELEFSATSTASPRFAHDLGRVPLHANARARLLTKLTVNDPGDIYEQEADRIADQVIRMPEPNLQRACAGGGGCPKRRKEEGGHEQLRTKRVQALGTRGTEVPPSVHEVLRSPGQPLDPATRTFFEPRFGHDFSQVRVHTDSQAAASARAVNAIAYAVGQDIAFGEGQYAPQTVEGRQLLAHELTHVVHQRGASDTVSQPRRSSAVLQRKNAGSKPAKKSYPYSVTASGCDKAPYNTGTVEAAARKAFDQVKDSDCVKSETLKENILSKFNGLDINCKQDTNKGCGDATSYFSPVNIYPAALASGCGPLESTILHEVVHLTEWEPWGHRSLAAACEASCFGWGSGDPSQCTFEKGWVPALGVTGGGAFPGKGTPTWQARLYLGFERRSPIVGFVYPELGLGVGLIGETTTGGPSAITSGPSALVSLLGGLRLDPGKPGGGHLSFFGGPAVVMGSGKMAPGAEAGVALGYCWRWLDFSVDAGLAYDPTREAGMDRLFTLGASIRIGPSVPR